MILTLSSTTVECFLSPTFRNNYLNTNFLFFLQRGSDELLSQAAVMAPASDNNNQDLVSKKAKLEPGTVLGGVGKLHIDKYLLLLLSRFYISMPVKTKYGPYAPICICCTMLKILTHIGIAVNNV